MMQCLNVIESPLSIDIVFAPVKVAQPSISSILFFFIRKWTPLTRPSATLRLRRNASP